MGDRANIVVKQGKSFVHIYTHTAGYTLPMLLHKALKNSRDDWKDPAFLTAKIAEQIFVELSLVGISSSCQDNERKVLLVDPFERCDVTIWPRSRYDRWDEEPPGDDEKPLHRWTFDEYIDQTPEALVKQIHGIDL